MGGHIIIMLMTILTTMIIILATINTGIVFTRAVSVIIMADIVTTASTDTHADTIRAMGIGHGGQREYDHRVTHAARMNARRQTPLPCATRI